MFWLWVRVLHGELDSKTSRTPIGMEHIPLGGAKARDQAVSEAR